MEQVKLSKQEKETAIIFNEQEDYATIETYNRRLIKRLEVLCKNHKDFFTVENDSEMGIYKIPKKYVGIAKPRIKSEYQKTKAGIHGANALKKYHWKQKNKKK